MRVLVTGGAGFVGLNIAAELLARGHEVVAADLAAPPAGPEGWACRWERLDVRDAAAVERLFEAARPDAVVHGAAVTAGADREKRDAAGIVAANLQGTLNALAAAAGTRTRRFLFLSSSSIYGENGYDDLPLDEGRTHPVPETLYAISKYAGERAALRARSLHGLDVVCARLSAAFGPWERDTGLRDTLSGPYQATLIAQAGGEAVLEREGWRDWVYGKDVASAVWTLLEAERPRHPVYNVGPGEPWLVADWCRRLETRFPRFRWRVGQPANVSMHAARDRNPLGVARLGEEFGWRARFGMDAAFEDYMDWLSGRTA
jgi:nucleoside-diphosphate-sugar epimerase